MEDQARYDEALGAATREIANLEGSIFVIAARLSGMTVPAARILLARGTMGSLIKDARKLAREGVADTIAKDALESLLKRCGDLADKRNAIMHSGHGYGASSEGDLVRVLIAKGGKSLADVGLAGEISPDVFRQLQREAHELNLELFDWMVHSSARMPARAKLEGDGSSGS